MRGCGLLSTDNNMQHSWISTSLSWNCIFSQNSIHTFQKQVYFFPSAFSHMSLPMLLLSSSPVFPRQESEHVSSLYCYHPQPQGQCLFIPNHCLIFLLLHCYHCSHVLTVSLFQPQTSVVIFRPRKAKGTHKKDNKTVLLI